MFLALHIKLLRVDHIIVMPSAHEVMQVGASFSLVTTSREWLLASFQQHSFASIRR